MTKLLTTAALLVALIAPAGAASSLPATFVGAWCPVGNTSVDEYVRCSDGELTIRRNAFEGNEMGCQLLKLISQDGLYYMAHFRCSSDEGNRHTTWYRSYWMSSSGQKLYMHQM